MYDTSVPSESNINVNEYRNKVLGCWTGKNIGGTLGAPFEGNKAMQNVSFYTQNLRGNPIPNDDLDLQLIWLLAAEENGLFRLNERILGEYWLTHITGPWNEYGVCKSNMINGLYPPLSGSCNNDTWKYSNGAWIRSEIWACLFPGSVDEALQFAYFDSCCDHCGEGIYAELFTAALESAAFIVSDIRELIKIGLSRIPDDCRIARSVKIACDCYDSGKDYIVARETLVKDSEDLGWFQAPANIGYVVIGLLYGEGDFGKSVCIATNCGDDTDCTAGTVGAILGIIYGRSGIPQEWIEPIGESIITCSIDTYGRNNQLPLPATLQDLTDRVISLSMLAIHENPTLINISKNETKIKDVQFELLHKAEASNKRILCRSPYELSFSFPFGTFLVKYENGPFIEAGKETTFSFSMSDVRSIEQVVSVKLFAPEGWCVSPSNEVIFKAKCGSSSLSPSLTIIPDKTSQAFYYLRAEILLTGRTHPVPINIPLQSKSSINLNSLAINYDAQNFWDASNRCKSRLNRTIASN